MLKARAEEWCWTVVPRCARDFGAGYFTSSKTPIHTRAAEIQRRRSTFSCRMNLDNIAEQIKVSEAEAGATRLASPHESAVSRQKKLKMRQASPRRKSLSRMTWPITVNRP